MRQKIGKNRNIVNSHDTQKNIMGVFSVPGIIKAMFLCIFAIGLFIIKGRTAAITRDNDNFIDDTFRAQNPSDSDIVYALYGNNTDSTTAYTMYWDAWRNNSCNNLNFTVSHVSNLPTTLSQNTIYVLESGSVINTTTTTMSNCSAIISKGNSIIYSTNTAPNGMIYLDNIQYGIIDNIGINGTNDGGNGTHNASIGLNISRANNNTFNQIKIFNSTDGINIRNTSYDKFNNLLIFNNSSNGIYISKSTYIAINNSLIFNNDWGINIFGPQNNNNLYNNIACYNNQTQGIYMDSNGTKTNNFNDIISFNNGGYGFYISNKHKYYGSLTVFGNDDDTVSTLAGGAQGTIGWSAGSLTKTGEITYDIIANPVDDEGNYLIPWTLTGFTSNIRGPQSALKYSKYSYGQNIFSQKSPVFYNGTNLALGGGINSQNFIGANFDKKVSDIYYVNDIVRIETGDENIQYGSFFGKIDPLIGLNVGESTGYISGAKTIAQLYGDNYFATHFIVSGIVDLTPPTCLIEYDPTTPTSGNVLSTITGCDEPISILNNNGNYTYLFENNGEFIFEVSDVVGNTGYITGNVTRIDKIAPTCSVEYDPTTPTSGNVVATLTGCSEEITITNNDGSNTITLDEPLEEFTFTFQDTVGNTGEALAIAIQIDRATPTCELQYNTTNPTNGNVVAALTGCSEDVTIINNSGNNNYIITENGIITSEFIDLAGNIGVATGEVDWIDKIPPTFEIENRTGYECSTGELIIENYTDNLGLPENAFQFFNLGWQTGNRYEIIGNKAGNIFTVSGYVRDLAGNITEKYANYEFIDTGVTANDFSILNVGSGVTINWKAFSEAKEGDCNAKYLSAEILSNGSIGVCEISGSNIIYTSSNIINGDDMCILTISDMEGNSTDITVTFFDVISYSDGEIALGVPNRISFNTQVSSEDKAVEFIFSGAFFVDDERGSDSGWYTTISATDLYGAGNENLSINKSNIFIKSSGIQKLSGDDNNSVAINTSLSDYVCIGEPTMYIYRNAGLNNYKKGAYGDIPNLMINIPAYQTPDLYKGSLIFTIYENN